MKQTPLQQSMAKSNDVRSEFFVVPLQKVPIKDWGMVRPREKQVEMFRRTANALEQQWITDLESTWNVTRWFDARKEGGTEETDGPMLGKKSVRIQRGQNGRNSKENISG